MDVMLFRRGEMYNACYVERALVTVMNVCYDIRGNERMMHVGHCFERGGNSLM